MAGKGWRHAGGVIVLFLAGAGVGCANNTQRGTAMGAVGGSALGAIVGHQLGDSGMGALVGGLAGAAAGGLAGNAQDESERADAYAQQAAYQQRQRVYEARSMSNRDVINMAYSGASDGLIISTMQSRGGRFDTSPDAIIHLHKQGVSDRVIQAMQQVESNRYSY